jgi:hypothetical protein
MNFGDDEATIETAGFGWISHPDGAPIPAAIQLPRYGLRMMRQQP